MRVSCAWDDGEQSYVPKWDFLNTDRNPLVGKGARATNSQEFFSFLPVFYLDALRDADDEFASRSQFWGRLLRTVKVPEPLEQKSVRIFNLLNAKLLAADPMLGELATSLSNISRVATKGTPGQASIRMLPLNTWDLLSKAEVIYQDDGAKPWLPLMRHGQGVQSLSVMFLFPLVRRVVAWRGLSRGEHPCVGLGGAGNPPSPTSPRTLFGHLAQLQGQKIVSTHSPYFLQHVPFRDLRVVRAGPDGTIIKSLPREFRCRVPNLPDFARIIAASKGLLEYDGGLSELVINGSLPMATYRDLLLACDGHADVAVLHARLRAAREHRSNSYLMRIYKNSRRSPAEFGARYSSQQSGYWLRVNPSITWFMVWLKQ